MAAGDDHAGRRAAAIAVVDRGGRGDVVVDVGVERGEREELVVLAASERRDVGMAKRLPDVDVLSGFAVLGERTLDQLVELVGAEDGGMLELAVAPVGPGEFDAPVMAAVEPALEQMADMPAHHRRIGLDHGRDVAHVHRTHSRKGAEGRSPPAMAIRTPLR